MKAYRRGNKPTGPGDFYSSRPRHSGDVLPVLLSYKFTRKARAYKRAYCSGESMQHSGLKVMVKCFQGARHRARLCWRAARL